MKQFLRKIFSLKSFGMFCQMLLWIIVFILLFTVFTTGFDFNEFRYVGF